MGVLFIFLCSILSTASYFFRVIHNLNLAGENPIGFFLEVDNSSVDRELKTFQMKTSILFSQSFESSSDFFSLLLVSLVLSLHYDHRSADVFDL